MLKPSASLLLGAMFVIIGAINVWLILQASARVNNSRASARLIKAHRIGGYLFILIFCVLSYLMISRMQDSSATMSSGTLGHMTVAMLLTPLLFVKVLIARYYKNYYSLLMPLGLLIFVLSFVLVAMAAGPYLIHNRNIRSISLDEINLTNTTMDFTQAAATMQQRCSLCHNLERVVAARKDARGWLATVNRMRQLPASGISEADVKAIVLFLASQHSPAQSDAQASLAVARALVNQRCSACHSLDRVFKTAKTPAEWRETVNKMVMEAQTDGNAGIFHPGEDQQIVDFLSKTQTPEVVNQRVAQASLAASDGTSLIKSEIETTPLPLAKPEHLKFKTTILIFAGCAGAIVMIVRRPGKIPPASPLGTMIADVTTQATPPAASNDNSVILKLVRITRQTLDAQTLRFALAKDCHLAAKPGQFLTFTFLFDGKKVVRSYSICSSPAATGYVEITPKRVANGCASVFLNDQAAIGMTVEARGPFGQFCLDETRHKRVVFIAGGSGITPLMAMLRYLDDYCLPTAVTLLYCVRTCEDIIFQSDLEELQTRLTHFQYHLLLSQPPAEWSGSKGRLSREFVESKIEDPASKYFFICGPGPLMDSACQILSSLGVPPEKIIQESFGGRPPSGGTLDSKVAEPGLTVEFARSKKVHSTRPGQTLLQAAEQCGVNIPSGCRQGQCGTCRVKLLEGAVSMDAEQGLPHDLKEQGYVLTCVGHAKGPVKLDV